MYDVVNVEVNFLEVFEVGGEILDKVFKKDMKGKILNIGYVCSFFFVYYLYIVMVGFYRIFFL